MNGALMLSDDYLDEAASKFARFHSIKYEFPDLPYKARHERVSDEMREILYGRHKNHKPFTKWPSSKDR